MSLSPLVLEYAQQVRVYVFLMLAATIAVAAAVSATKSPRPGRWLVVAAVASVLAMWLHYTGALVVAPLAVWIGIQPGIRRSVRAAFIATNALALIALIPLFLDQRHNSPEGQLVGIPGLTWTTAARILETPFDGRTNEGLDTFRVLGVLVIAAALIAVILLWRRQRPQGWGLLCGAAATPLAALLALGLAGEHVVLTRYTTVAAPFLLITLAIAITRLPLRWAGPLALAATAVTATGLIRTHQPSGYYLNAKGAIDFVQQHRKPADTVITPGSPGIDPQLDYYAQRRLQPLPRIIAGQNPQAIRATFQAKQNAWTIQELPAGATHHPTRLKALVQRALAPFGYDIETIHVFPATVTLLITRATRANASPPEAKPHSRTKP